MYVRTPFIIESVALAIIPFEEVLSLPIGSVLRIVNLITICSCLIEPRKIKFEKKRNQPLVPMLLFLFYVIISFFWCYNQTFYFDRLSTYGLYGILISLLCSLSPRDNEKKKMLNGLLAGGIVASMMIVFSGASSNIGGRDTLVIFGRMIDPNILSYSCVLSLAICMCHVFFEKKHIVIYCIVSVLLLAGIIMCGSRSALVTCFATTALIVLNIDVKKNKLVKKTFVVLFFFLAILFVYFEFILTSEFGARFTFDNLIGQGSMGTANRDKIWSAALEQFAKRPILGYGNGSSMYAIEEVYRFYGTHNSYLLVLLEFGVIGFYIVSLWQLSEYKALKKNNNKVYKILFYSMLSFIFFVEGFSTKVFWGLQVLLMTACYGNSNVKDSMNITNMRR